MRDGLTFGIGGDGVVALGSFPQNLAAWQGYFRTFNPPTQ
jgi:hypothetical protein